MSSASVHNALGAKVKNIVYSSWYSERMLTFNLMHVGFACARYRKEKMGSCKQARFSF